MLETRGEGLSELSPRTWTVTDCEVTGVSIGRSAVVSQCRVCLNVACAPQFTRRLLANHAAMTPEVGFGAGAAVRPQRGGRGLFGAVGCSRPCLWWGLRDTELVYNDEIH